MPNREELRQTYASMPDRQLIQIAIHEASDLIPEAVEVLQEELRKRNLADSLGLAVAAQAREWAPLELEALVQRVRQFPCPMCGSTAHPLNVFRIVTFGRFWVPAPEDQLLLGCPECIERAAKKALRGCWARALSSPIAAVSASIVNEKATMAHTVTEPTPEFTEYVLRNRGTITLALQGFRR